jgi:hypothetical protein
MKLGQTGLFMESPEFAGRSNLKGGPPWALGHMGPTLGQPHHYEVESKSGLPS